MNLNPIHHSEQNQLFPVFLKLDSLDTLIVGGGEAALAKLNKILALCPDAKIAVVAESIHHQIRKIAATSNRIWIIDRSFRVRDLVNKNIVFLTTDDQELHRRIIALTRKRRILVNVATEPSHSDFILAPTVGSVREQAAATEAA